MKRIVMNIRAKIAWGVDKAIPYFAIDISIIINGLICF